MRSVGGSGGPPTVINCFDRPFSTIQSKHEPQTRSDAGTLPASHGDNTESTMMMLATLLAAAASPGPTDVQAWSDANGQNTLTWSTDGAITVNHRVISSGKHYWYRQLSIDPPECLGGEKIFEMADAVTVTDADRDGIDEVSFALRSGCPADGGMLSLSVYLWEDGAMHQLWGETAGWHLDGAETVAASQLSASLDDAPVLAFAMLDRFAAELRSASDLQGVPLVLHGVDSQQ